MIIDKSTTQVMTGGLIFQCLTLTICLQSMRWKLLLVRRNLLLRLLDSGHDTTKPLLGSFLLLQIYASITQAAIVYMKLYQLFLDQLFGCNNCKSLCTLIQMKSVKTSTYPNMFLPPPPLFGFFWFIYVGSSLMLALTSPFSFSFFVIMHTRTLHSPTWDGPNLIYT